MRKVERQIMLAVMDRLWVEHLTEMDDLREGVGLQAYGQRDPLVVYKTEGYRMFQQLLDHIQHDVVHTHLPRAAGGGRAAGPDADDAGSHDQPRIRERQRAGPITEDRAERQVLLRQRQEIQVLPRRCRRQAEDRSGGELAVLTLQVLEQ